MASVEPIIFLVYILQILNPCIYRIECEPGYVNTGLKGTDVITCMPGEDRDYPIAFWSDRKNVHCRRK